MSSGRSSGGGLGGMVFVAAPAAGSSTIVVEGPVVDDNDDDDDHGRGHDGTKNDNVFVDDSFLSTSASSSSSHSDSNHFIVNTSSSDGEMTQDTTPLNFSSSPSSSPDSLRSEKKSRSRLPPSSKQMVATTAATATTTDENKSISIARNRNNNSKGGGGGKGKFRNLLSRFTNSNSSSNKNNSKKSNKNNVDSNNTSSTKKNASRKMSNRVVFVNDDEHYDDDDDDDEDDDDDLDDYFTQKEKRQKRKIARHRRRTTKLSPKEQQQQELRRKQRQKDPVIAIFESRATQRVRFCFEDNNTNSSNSNNKNRNAATTTTTTSGSGSGSATTSSSVSKSRFSKGNEKFPTSSSSSITANKNNSQSSNSAGTSGSSGNIKQFMSRALFGSSSKTGNSSYSNSNNSSNDDTQQLLTKEEIEREVKEVGGGSLIWESAMGPPAAALLGPDIVATRSCRNKDEPMLSFVEDPKISHGVTKLLAKAQKAETVHFRYEYAVKCYLKVMKVLDQAKYPEDHPTVTKTVQLLNNAHHVLSSYNNSAEIVKIGIRNEDSGELVKALKMYTIAYRIRRDNLSRNHPSLVVLLNMLGSIQIKRGELNEAMQIYELALNDAPPVMFSAASEDEEDVPPPVENLLAKSVTYREMGTIFEMWGRIDEALQFFHKSLECVAEWRETVRGADSSACAQLATNGDSSDSHLNVIEASYTTASSSTKNPAHSSSGASQYGIEHIQPMSSVGDQNITGQGSEHGEMELVIGKSSMAHNVAGVVSSTPKNAYEKYFPNKEDANTQKGLASDRTDENSHADMDLALTLHQIAQLYRAQGKFARALDAYEISLRGMKIALGKHHPNCAAILGNIGNLQKEMGDLDAASTTYQEVLGIESYRLGLSHPDVAITLHNIATIDSARGNYDHALELYQKVIGLQKKLFGGDNLSVAVTAACMGDVYEKLGQIDDSVDSFEEAVQIKSKVLGRHSLDVGRLLHKLGKLSFLKNEYLESESFTSRAILIYRLNKLPEDHEWFLDAYRDTADIDAKLATCTIEEREI